MWTDGGGAGGGNWQTDDIPTGEQEYSYDASGMAGEDLGGPPKVNKVGWYHMEITDVIPDLSPLNDKGEEKSPSVRFQCAVQHTVPGQCPAGTRFEHRIFLAGAGGKPASEGSKKMAIGFGFRIGLLEEITPQGEERPRIVIKGTTNSNITSKTWLQAKGMHFITEIKHTPAEGNFGEKWEIAYGSPYRPDDPFVEEVPKNVEILKAIGFKNVSPGVIKQAPQGAAAAPATKATSKKPPVAPPQQQQQTPPPSAPAIDLSDL